MFLMSIRTLGSSEFWKFKEHGWYLANILRTAILHYAILTNLMFLLDVFYLLEYLYNLSCGHKFPHYVRRL